MTMIQTSRNNKMGLKPTVSVEANLRSKARRACCAGRSQSQVVVRFWIITMMLVLVGRPLKLR